MKQGKSKPVDSSDINPDTADLKDFIGTWQGNPNLRKISFEERNTVDLD